MILNLMSQKPDSEMLTKLQHTVTNEEWENVTDKPIYRGDKRIQIGEIQFDNYDFDQIVTGDIHELYMDDNHLYAKHDNDVHVIEKVDPIEDTNVTRLKFKPKGESPMITEKVVGTSFAFRDRGEKHYTEFAGHDVENDNVKERIGVAILNPMPENPYDENAVAVIARMADGKAFQLGYLAKGSELYNKVKKATVAKLIIYAYSEGGDYNDSFQVEVDENSL